MVVLREAVRLVADRLTETQAEVLPPEPDRLGAPRHEEELLLLRERHDVRRLHAQLA